MIVWQDIFSTFFAQDDFVLITQFSKHSLWIDLKNALGPSQASHWRPIHNLYFLISGNLFGKIFPLYHIFTYLFHLGGAFFIYKIVREITKNYHVASMSAVIYVVHPSHFISLFWISGGAITLGIFFLSLAFYFYLRAHKVASLFTYSAALLASEAMAVGLILFLAWDILFKKTRKVSGSHVILFLLNGFFLLLKFLLSPKGVDQTYQLALSLATLQAIKFYSLRVLGFAETNQDQVLSVLLTIWLVVILILVLKQKFAKKSANIIFSGSVLISGLFPFVLIPYHLSPHYMSISIWGFSMITGLAIKKLDWATLGVGLIFVILSFFSVAATQNNNWVIKRSKLAKIYLENIELTNREKGSTLVFENNKFSSSREAYFTLGTGVAVDFWFKDKNYKTCFSEFEKCPAIP